MNIELLLLIKKLTDTLIQQTQTRLQETLRFVMMETFSSNPRINLAEVGKWLLAVTSFEGTNSVFNMTDENNSFSFSTPAHWTPENGEKFINKLNNLLEVWSENSIESHVEEVWKRGTRKKTVDKDDKCQISMTCKIEIIQEIKRVKYKDLEDMIYRLELIYD